jgi:hypothetical protein
MLYHIITVINKIAVRELGDVSKESIDRVTPKSPYRLLEDYSNPLARALRERDHIIDRGFDGTGAAVEFRGFADTESPTVPMQLLLKPNKVDNIEVVVVDSSKDVNGNPYFYMFKMYENGEWKDNPELTEEERMEKARIYFTRSPLPLGKDRQDYLRIDYSEVKDYMTEDEYETSLSKMRAHESLSEEEYQRYYEITGFTFSGDQSRIRCNNLYPIAKINKPIISEELSVRMRYRLASASNSRCLSFISGATSKKRKDNKNKWFTSPFILPSLKNSTEWSKTAVKWWDTLIGTELEIKAMSEKAHLYINTEREDDAMDIYKDLLKKPDLSYSIFTDSEIRANIEEKITYFGYGRQAYNDLVVIFESKDYRRVLSESDKWMNTASGEVKKYLKSMILEIKLQSRIEILKAKLSSESMVIPDHVLHFLAWLDTDIAILESRLPQLKLFARNIKKDITVDITRIAFKDIINEGENKFPSSPSPLKRAEPNAFGDVYYNKYGVTFQKSLLQPKRQ